MCITNFEHVRFAGIDIACASHCISRIGVFLGHEKDFFAQWTILFYRIVIGPIKNPKNTSRVG